MRYTKAMLCAGLALGAAPTWAADTRLDWLAGHWCGGDAERKIDEVWLPQAGGNLLGMSRTVRGDATESFEFMRVSPNGKSPGLYVQPNGELPTVFSIAERGEDWIRFENAAHDFPNRIEYRRKGDALHAWIAGPGPDGREMKIPFEYRRCGG